MARNINGNVVLNEDFSQVCVWPGCQITLGENAIEPKDFEDAMLSTYGWRVQYLEEILTGPDLDENGAPISGTGGRCDLLFAMHQDDITTAALRRLQMGIRWIEDVLAPYNYRQKIYPERVKHYCSWEAIAEETTADTVQRAEADIAEFAEQAAAANTTPTKEPKVTYIDPTPAPIEPAPDAMMQMAQLLFQALKPQIKEFIEATIDARITDKVQSEMVTAQKELQVALQDELGSDRAFIEHLVSEVQTELVFDDLLDSNEFRDAVSETVSNMDFSISAEGRRFR